MKKLFIIALAVLGMLACSDQNAPINPNAKDGALPGKFSVSSNKQVQFSQGNLQYRASSKVWRFAGNQYDIVGKGNEKISSSYSGWIDLFGWGTGDNPTLSSLEVADYNSFVDWGENAISNGGNRTNMWRTLTKDEWKYLLFLRTNADNLRGRATVNKMPGYIILPDGANRSYFEPNMADWTTNTYSAREWEQIETAGAVFLPAAGWRQQPKWIYWDVCYYWSATSSVKPEYACCFVDAEYEFGNIDACYRTDGQSVRLVKDVE